MTDRNVEFRESEGGKMIDRKRDHTPGPWTFERQADLDEEIDTTCYYCGASGYVWAIRGSHPNGDEVQNPAYANSLANAKLIAHAPALLHASADAGRIMRRLMKDESDQKLIAHAPMMKAFANSLANAEGIPAGEKYSYMMKALEALEQACFQATGIVI